MIKAVITDIEGTTSSLSFVKDILFPYARTHLAEFVEANQHNPAVGTLLEDACREVGQALTLPELIALFKQWIDEDKKVTSLKSLQGLIWQDGYDKGAFTGHLYSDAVENLKRWKAKGLQLYIYSSGSVQAQKLLFAHTDYGDLTALFSGYFDTHIGGKKEVQSYQRIAGQIAKMPAQLLFLSDSEDELDAAAAAGYQTIWLVRDSPLDKQTPHRQVHSFDQIEL